MLDGRLLITGAVLSITVTVVTQLLLAPFESVTVKVTFVVPIVYGPIGYTLNEIASPLGSVDPLSKSAAVAIALQFSLAKNESGLQAATGS